ncbi:hypothetical protein DPMN_103491 [Dreissena polymorpha]|uniref:Sushi domain-containing protein n=1 Tax=Dreissena polymorpha TaxID=45954 RepID=A0A9D4H9V4_DREPO|nr:hypothetical protein DPMN_103491 [Dreissena polymorpha]
MTDCGYLIAPQHGNVSHINTTYGSTATISCQTGYILNGSNTSSLLVRHTGYILNGSNTSSCDSSGFWNSTTQTCTVLVSFISVNDDYDVMIMILMMNIIMMMIIMMLTVIMMTMVIMMTNDDYYDDDYDDDVIERINKSTA